MSEMQRMMMDDANREYKELMRMLPQAIAKEEFQVYYQPKVDLRNYRLSGAEALCRWIHEGELVPPGKFIPILEKGKAICTLDFYMLDHVCRDLRRWIDEGRQIVRISINLSRRHTMDDNLLDTIMNIIDRYDVPYEYVEVELTETTTDVEFKGLKSIVNGLMERGVQIAVDDFGVGYSSLNLIRELPWNVLKIDRSFLPEGNNKISHKTVMLQHVIDLAQGMGLECLAEGVETLDQVRMLKENHCAYAQGYFFDKPMPRPEFEKRLEAAATDATL